MPKSRTRYARAQARARYRKPKRSNTSMGWNLGIAGIVVVGVVLIVFTVSGNDSGSSEVPPRPANQVTGELGDHWHAAFDVNICGEKLPDPPTFESPADNPNVRVGVHTHGDGVIHIHPFNSSESGENATLGRFFDYGGWSLSEDSVDFGEAPSFAPDKAEWTNGDTCSNPDGSEGRGVLRWSVNGKERQGDPADYRPQNQDQIMIFFGPRDAELPEVASRTPEQDSADPSQPIGEPTTTAPTTTVPAASEPPSS
jgi:hypothetical protein